MKNIKRKIFQIILTVFMVFSSCFLTGTVEAVDDTGNAARSSGYFTNENIYVSNNEIVRKENFKGERPEFVASSISTGSDLSENATEGMVWTNKKIEIFDKNTGIYKITFQALGFKYRNVDENNVKEDNVWKNPLAAGSTLTISEKIAENFHVIEDEEAYPMELAKGYADYFKEDNGVNIHYDPKTNTVTLSFNADNVHLDEYDDNNEFYYDDENNNDDNGIAFDVEGSFYVQIDSEVGAGTYPTGNADSSFKPATDNFYYYEWGTTSTEVKYTYDGINWSNNEDSMKGIRWFANITIPDNKGTNKVIFTVGNSGNYQHSVDPTRIQKEPGNYLDSTPMPKGQNDYYYIDVKNALTSEYNWAEYGISNLYFYWVAGKGEGENKIAYARIEVQYVDGTWMILEPEKDLNNNAGILGLGDLKTSIFISKDSPMMQEGKDPDGDGVIKNQFTNHGKITLTLPSIENVETKKTASLINWDDRTYRIDLYARSILKQQAEPVDIMFALDFSGSMPWLISEPSQTITYKELNTVANKDEYNIIHMKTEGTIAKWQSFEYFIYDESAKEYKPIGYFNDENCPNKPDPEEGKFAGAGWYALKSQGAVGSSKENAGNIIYNEKIKIDSKYNGNIYKKTSADKTKLDKLLEQVQSFIDSLADSSPDSRVGFTVYAGRKIDNKGLENASNLIGDGLNEFVKNLKLEGNTRQGVGIKESADLLQDSDRNKYIIMFTDGIETEKGDGEWAYNAATDARDNGIQIYTIGLASEDVLNATPENMGDCPDNGKNFISRLQRWSSGEGYYYAASNYTAFEEAFNSIFDDLVGSIKNVTIIDVIDDRFEITEESKEKLEKNGIEVDGNKVIWNIEELRYCEEVLDGLHLSIEIVAKDDFLGGNYIPTNVAFESIVKVGNTTDQLDKPVVNVKPQLELNNGEKTYFLGEEIDPIEYIDTLLDQSNISLTDLQKERLITDDEISIDYSYKNTADKLGTLTFKYEPITTDGKVSNLETHNASKASDDVEEYKLTVTYDVDTSEERQNIIGSSYSYTDNSFTNEHDNCTHTETDELIGKPHIANDIEASGLYIVNVVDGSIKINKTINNKVADPGTQGDTIVTFLIEGETVSGQNVHRYEVVRFNSIGTKSFTIDGLEKGVYTITELNSIRYDLADDGISIIKNDTKVPIVNDKENKKVTFYIGYTSTNGKTTNLEAKNVEATFTNELVNDENIGDTDVVTNSFEVNENGSVTITKDYYTVSQD